jgi:hypothetical protein
VDGGKEVYYASRTAPGYLQNGTDPKLRVVEVFILREVCRSRLGS